MDKYRTKIVKFARKRMLNLLIIAMCIIAIVILILGTGKFSTNIASIVTRCSIFIILMSICSMCNLPSAVVPLRTQFALKAIVITILSILFIIDLFDGSSLIL
jgi:hypothetical protein